MTGRARGRLRIYLGAAPGVGKTYAMLDEGRRRRDRGTDVVIGYVESHGRPKTEAQVGDLEVVPRQTISHRDVAFAEMDLDAVLARGPEVALVDELAHTNVPGSRNAKRWQDVDELLAAGIDVISTVNVQHLESLHDVVEEITGVDQRETVPDTFVRAAEQIELVDMTPEALRRRMAHGNIYRPDKIDAALGNYFRAGNLTALRELALLWVADQVDTALHDYRERHGIADPWETRERVAVALTGAPGADDLIRRAGRIARRTKAELIGIHVETPDGLAGDGRGALDEHRRLLADLGGTYREVVDTEIARALVRTAIAENATQLVLGATRRSRWSEIVRGSIVGGIAQHANGRLDLHIIATQVTPPDARAEAERDRGLVHPAARAAALHLSRLSRRRQGAGWLATVVGLPLLTLLLDPFRERLGFASVGFCYLLAVVAIGTLGGVWVAMVAALAAFLLLNWFFADPIHTFTISNERDAIALVAFLLVASVVSVLVERAARRSADARRARREAEALASMAGLLLRDDDPLPDLVTVLVATFDLEGASVLRAEGAPAGRRWVVEAAAGDRAPVRPDAAALSLPLAPDVQLAVAAPALSHDDRRILDTFATHLAVALVSRRLRAEADHAAALAKAHDLRSTLLAAVSHDLRTPLTTIKTSASSLLDPEVDVDRTVRRELLQSIDDESDRLNDLVGDLLDLGRIEADSVIVAERSTDLHEVVASALAHTPVSAEVAVDLPAELPMVRADPVLLERAVANVLANAARYTPVGGKVVVVADAVDGDVVLRVVDRGPGIPRAERGRAFRPFERLDEPPETAGIGLGLAVARGFVEAMDGRLEVDETPGGGTTMAFTLTEDLTSSPLGNRATADPAARPATNGARP